jgi:hypothetical protein
MGAASFPLLSNATLATVYAGLTTVDRDLEALTLGGAERTLAQATVQELADSLRGSLLLPGNAAYDTARLVLNPVIDKYPALIVQPSGPADVSSAVQFARDNALEVAVKCGGHSSSGKSTCNGGMLIDLSGFRDVRLDLDRRSAFVTGGSLLGQIDHEAMALGLVTTAGTVSHTGVGGLATAGGFGRLGRRFGLTLDNIRSVDVVSADGVLRHANASEHPDLYWAVRGGGGNFGVVTSFEFQLHPMERTVLGGDVVFPMSEARRVLEVYADYSVNCPDELYTDLILAYPPGGGDGAVQISVCYSGDPSRYEKLMRPYLEIGKPLKNSVKAVDYVALQRSTDSSDPRAVASYLKSGFISEFSPALIDDVLNGLEPNPARFTMMYFQHAGGAITRVAEDATAFPHRYLTHAMMAMVAWPPGSGRELHVPWIKEYWRTMEPHAHGFYTVDVADEAAEIVNKNYRGNYKRLVKVKNRYDPTNMFRLNANVVPTA